MQPATYISQVTGLPLAKWRDHVELRQDANGVIVVDRWDESLGVKKPTAEALAEALASPEPAAPVVVPETISDRQFFQQLAVDGDIKQDEALAAVTTGTLPQKLSDAIARLPQDEQFAAKMLCCGATEFMRSNPMVELLGQALGKDSAALDAIWVAAAAL